MKIKTIQLVGVGVKFMTKNHWAARRAAQCLEVLFKFWFAPVIRHFAQYTSAEQWINQKGLLIDDYELGSTIFLVILFSTIITTIHYRLILTKALPADTRGVNTLINYVLHCRLCTTIR